MLVDDEPEALRAFERTLRGAGYLVEAFTSARAAIERVSAGGVHVVVSDISMPEMDGRGLIHRIRELDTSEGGAIPAVALTAYFSPTDRTRTLLAGYQLYLA